MTESEARGSADHPVPRGTVILLMVAIACVLSVGAWLLSGRGTDKEFDKVATDGPGLFYMPADFDPQEYIFLAAEPTVLPHPILPGDVLRAVASHVGVVVAVGSPDDIATVRDYVATLGIDASSLDFTVVPGASRWLRDAGALTVTDSLGRRSLVEFRGTPGSDREPSANVISAQLADQMDLPIMGHALHVQGGDLLSNGRGLGLMSRRVLEINEGFRDKDAGGIVRSVAALVGMETIKVLPYLEGASRGHIDGYCAFVAADHVVVARVAAEQDADNSALLDEVAEALEGLPTLAGEMRVSRIDHPGFSNGIWRSYTGVVFANDVVLVPTYPGHCPDLDARALAAYRRMLPEREIVGIDASEAARKNRSLRDMVLNLPAGAPAVPEDREN